MENSSTRSHSGPGRLTMHFDDQLTHNFNKTYPTFYLDQELLEEAFEAVDNKFMKKEDKQFKKLVAHYDSNNVSKVTHLTFAY